MRTSVCDRIIARPFAAALIISLALGPGAYAQDAPLPAAGKSAAKAKAVAGQWMFAPESDVASKLAWQYTPGSSEFLALVIGCDSSERSSYIIVDLSVEARAKGRVTTKIAKGNRSLVVTGTAANGESGPFVKAVVPYPEIAQLLDQPGDIVAALPHHRLSFSAKSLAGPSTTFVKACRLGEGQ